jgi:hypothetical protein
MPQGQTRGIIYYSRQTNANALDSGYVNMKFRMFSISSGFLVSFNP